MIETFGSIERVKELFYNYNCVGADNCYIIAYKDFARNSGMHNGIEYPYDALLINQTNEGIGIFYLNQGGFIIKQSLSKMIMDKNSFMFISNKDIEEISVRNFAPFNSKSKRITIRLKDGKTHRLFANMKEKLIPYQAENMLKFVKNNE